MEAEEIDKAEHTVDQNEVGEEPTAPKSDGKLILAEELSEGHVGWPARKSIIFSFSILTCLTITL